MDRYLTQLENALAQLGHARAQSEPDAGPPLPPANRAADYLPAASVDLTDDELILVWAELTSDPAAQDQIMATLAWRDEVAAQRDAEIEQYRQQQQQERQEAAAAQAASDDASPLTNPARRAGRALTAEQVCREEYDAYVHDGYVIAETACRGQMLTRESVAAGIHPLSLFSGPAARARKHASAELRAWWSQNGRVTYAEWRYQWFGRDSDRKAARTARFQSLGESTL